MRPQQTLNIATKSGWPILVKIYGQIPYSEAQQAMIDFNLNRDSRTEDQIWLLEHPPVYTQGTACQQTTILESDIPIVKSDRGGQITYHGPGQVVMYPLLKLKRYNLGVKSLVAALEQAVLNCLKHIGVTGERREDAPGVYVDQAKIAALGLRIKKGSSYHGLSFNINMDLAPFSNIDPCGYQGLNVTQLKDCIAITDIDDVSTDNMKMSLLEQFSKLI